MVFPITVDNIRKYGTRIQDWPVFLYMSANNAFRGQVGDFIHQASGITQSSWIEFPLPIAGFYTVSLGTPAYVVPWVFDQQTGQYKEYAIDVPLLADGVTLNSDGLWLIAWAGNTFYVYKNNWVGYKFMASYTHGASNIHRIRFSPTDDRIAITNNGSNVYVDAFNDTTGIVTFGVSLAVAAALGEIAWRSDGVFFAAGHADPVIGRLYVLNTGGGSSSLTVQDSGTAMANNRQGVTFNKDGTYLYYATDQINNIMYATFDGSNMSFVGYVDSPGVDAAAEIQLSPDGKYILITSFSTTTVLFYDITANIPVLADSITGISTSRSANWTNFFNV